jgi:hypothetical protein
MNDRSNQRSRNQVARRTLYCGFPAHHRKGRLCVLNFHREAFEKKNENEAAPRFDFY